MCRASRAMDCRYMVVMEGVMDASAFFRGFEGRQDHLTGRQLKFDHSSFHAVKLSSDSCDALYWDLILQIKSYILFRSNSFSLSERLCARLPQTGVCASQHSRV